jgi:hypothetical protein
MGQREASRATVKAFYRLPSLRGSQLQRIEATGGRFGKIGMAAGGNSIPSLIPVTARCGERRGGDLEGGAGTWVEAASYGGH